MATIYAVDCSFDELTDQEAVNLKAAGVELFIQCLWTGADLPPPRVINLRRASNAGLAIAAYASLSASAYTGAFHMISARNGVPNDLWDLLTFCAVDVELPGIRLAAIEGALASVKQLGQNKKYEVVYSSWNAWVNYVVPRNDTTIAGRGVYLWNANWDQQPDIDFPSLPFGGWTLQQVIGEQWSGGTLVNGQFADQNTFVKELLWPQVNADTCALPRMRAQFLEECSRAMADGDYQTLYRWSRFFGGGP